MIDLFIFVGIVSKKADVSFWIFNTWAPFKWGKFNKTIHTFFGNIFCINIKMLNYKIVCFINGFGQINYSIAANLRFKILCAIYLSNWFITDTNLCLEKLNYFKLKVKQFLHVLNHLFHDFKSFGQLNHLISLKAFIKFCDIFIHKVA